MNKEEVFQFLCSANDKSGYLKKEKGFKKNFPELYAELITWNFPEEFIFQQKLYHYFRNDSDFKLGLCPICGNRCGFNNFKIGYNKHCCLKCAHQDDNVLNKTKQIWMNKYGVENPMQSNEIKEKFKQTIITKYGVEHPLQVDIFKEKVQQTTMTNFGVKCSLQSKEIIEKSKITCLEKYGVENPSQSEEIKLKKIKTCLENYGVEYPIQSEKISNKIKQTNLKLYGYKNVFQSDKVKNKIIEKYGVKYYSQSNEFTKYHKKQIKYDGLMFDSSWEVKVYQYCKENNIPCEYQPDITFEYEYDGKKHYYHPDFLINNKIYEVKGDHFFNDNKMINPFDRTSDKLYEAKHQCMINNNIIILKEDDIKQLNNILKKG